MFNSRWTPNPRRPHAERPPAPPPVPPTVLMLQRALQMDPSDDCCHNCTRGGGIHDIYIDPDGACTVCRRPGLDRRMGEASMVNIVRQKQVMRVMESLSRYKDAIQDMSWSANMILLEVKQRVDYLLRLDEAAHSDDLYRNSNFTPTQLSSVHTNQGDLKNVHPFATLVSESITPDDDDDADEDDEEDDY